MNMQQSPFSWTTSESKIGSGNVSKTFMANVFSWMATALGISGIVAYLFGTDQTLIQYLMNERGLSTLGYVVMFAPLGIVLLMSMAFNRLSYTALVGVFLAYSILTGMSLSFIFLIYTMGSIFKVFAITAGMFGAMAFMGYTTKTDLTGFGAILRMALFGVIIAMLINFFTHSSTLEYIISIASVAIFTGLTAYDVQKLKGIGMQAGDSKSTMVSKVAIMGALTLYLDFLNLFLALLRLFGRRND